MNKPIRKAVIRVDRAQRESEIMTMALDVFAERGYEATSMAEIAARIGVVEGTLYKYFESKRELLIKVLENWYAALIDAFRRDLAGLSGARARLRYLVWRHLRVLHEDRLLCLLLFQEVRAERDYYQSGLHQMNRRYSQLLMDVMQEGMDSGEFRADVSPSLIRHMIFGGIEHHAWAFLCGHGELDIERLTGEVCAIAYAALMPVDESAGDPGRIAARLENVAARLEKLLPN
ncbi:MAG: TetR/AcrR family transcriptional regulator [Proteobacteria bacterium]|nr:TetR/AcrR family transcriptional regulator [Pseudomonadota bacterium]HQR04258.1 TetR/AcrR family transcriptional regulator [Rhodocyclaceae bacterium]